MLNLGNRLVSLLEVFLGLHHGPTFDINYISFTKYSQLPLQRI